MLVYVVQWENGIEHDDCLSVWSAREAADAQVERLLRAACESWHKGCTAHGRCYYASDYRVKALEVAV